jgi:phosphonate transport system substrate-binding protein
MAVRGLRSGPETRRGSAATATVRALLALLGLLLLTACGGASEAGSEAADGDLPAPLRVGVVPNQAPEHQQARFAPLAEALGEALGVEVELFVATNYAGVVTALAAGRLDVAYLGGLTYVQAERQVPLTPLVTDIDAETGTSRYLSALVVPADSPAGSADDLVRAGARVALGDPSSTSGSLYPRVMLGAAGADCSTTDLTACPPLAELQLTGGHDAAALAVAGGRADAAGLELRLLHRFEREGRIAPGALRVVDTHEVQGYPWVGRTALGEPALARVRAFFTGLDPDDADDAALLDLLAAESYVPVDAADYDEVRADARRTGLLR